MWGVDAVYGMRHERMEGGKGSDPYLPAVVADGGFVTRADLRMEGVNG